jgi:cbb3-type cytochrome oxidase subunit 3
LSAGIIAGIAVAAAFILCLALISVICIAYRRRRNHRGASATKGKHIILLCLRLHSLSTKRLHKKSTLNYFLSERNLL